MPRQPLKPKRVVGRGMFTSKETGGKPYFGLGIFAINYQRGGNLAKEIPLIKFRRIK